MDKVKKILNSMSFKVLSSNWVITLTATLIGVFLALFLSENLSSIKLDSIKKDATEKIFLEIKNNNDQLKASYQDHIKYLDGLRLQQTYSDGGNQIICHADTIQKFRKQYPNFLTITDSIRMENGLYGYKGSFDAPDLFSSINLSTFAIKAIKSSTLSNSYDFDCLIMLEKLEVITQKTIEGNNELLRVFKSRKDVEDIISLLEFVIPFEKTLLEFYEIVLNNKSEICG